MGRIARIPFIVLKVALLVAVWIVVGLAPAQGASNQSLVYQGSIIRPDGTTINSGTVTFTLSVYSPSPNRCLLYSETQSVNMTGSLGKFSLQLGTGARTDGGAHAFAAIFVNGSTLSGLSCAIGTVFAAAATDDRELDVSLNDSGNIVALSPMAIKSVPFALQAHEIDGWGLNNIVKVSSIGSPTTFTTIEMANAKAIAGASCALNEILKWNGTTWACASDATGGGGASDASFSAKGLVQGDNDVATSGLTFTSGVIKVNSGTAANQIVKLDGSAKLPAVDGSALTNLDPAHLSAAVPVTKGGTGQITAILGFNALSPITTKGDLVTSDGTNNVRLGVGANGYVLMADSSQTNGIKWAPVPTGTVTSVSSANSDISVATGTSTPVLTLNSGTSANQIVKLDGSAKLPAVDGSALTNLNAGNISSGTLPIARGGTAATSFAANAVIVSNGTGSALQALNCTSGQVITFDVSGYAVCGAAAGANGFVDGGNSFGASATLGTNDNYSLSIKTNNTPRMTILSTGEVGIGTTSPANKLHIVGDGNSLFMTPATSTNGVATYMLNAGNGSLFGIESSSGGALILGSTPYASVFGTQSARPFQIGTNNAVRMTVDSAGYVGIGTTTPSEMLHVAGNIVVEGSAPGTHSLGLRSDGLIAYIDNFQDGPIVLRTNNYGEKMRIAATTGYVGISNPNPGALLDIGTAGTTLGTFRLEGNTSGYVQIQPSAAAGSWTMTLPANAGTNGYVLSTNGSGVTSWVPAGGGGGGVTSVSSSNADIAVATGTSTPVLTLNSGAGANQIVKLDGSAKLPAVDGSALTNLNAGNISSGTLSIAQGGTNSGTALTNNKVMVSSAGAIIEGVGFGSSNTASTFVVRDASGDFAAGTMTGASLVTGTLKVTGGTPAAGKVLTSDASGNATWNSPSGITGSGTTNALPRFTGSGTLGDSGLVDNGSTITASRSIISTPNTVSSGATVDVSTSNTHLLSSVGGTTITLQNLVHGGEYNIIVADTTSRTYTFSGCTNSYFKPANSATIAGTQTVYGILVYVSGATTNCYITWSTGFQ